MIYELTKDTSYLTLTGKLWSVFYHKTSYHKILQSLRVVNMGDQIWLDHFEIWWVYWQHHQISKPYDNSVPWISQVWDIMRFYDKMSDQILKSTTGALLLTWINFNLSVIRCPVKCGMKLLIYTQTLMAAPLKFGNGWVISPHTS